jgi:uncharacterized membrane protein YdjX (TVP38/TMEM64 family)
MDIRKFRDHFGLWLLILSLVCIWYLGRYLRFDLSSLSSSLELTSLFISASIYLLLYVIVTFFVFFSKDLFWLSGAVLFGPYLSTFLICLAEAINAFILFFVSRFLGRNYVEDKLSGKYRYLDEKIANVNFFWLFVFRAAPLIPYRFLDLAAGLTKIRFRKYLLAVILGTPVKTLWIQYILFSLGSRVYSDPHALKEFFLNNKPLLLFSFIYIILVGLVIFKMREKRES